MDLAAPRQEERRFVTILFADLTGSTALGEQLDPERLRVLLGGYFKAMAEVIESWGGTVEKFVGDAVMAVFGIPTLHEDDSERALRAALAMHDKLAELNPEVEERHGVLLEVRIGVCSGDVISGTSGDQLMVTGDAVNVAARLQQSAEPGEVIVGERTYLAARGAHAAAGRALDAMARLDRLGQRYRAARLLVDLLPLLEAKEAHSVAEDVVPRLEEMGADTSAAQASSFA